jgi:hypothetical protein
LAGYEIITTSETFAAGEGRVSLRCPDGKIVLGGGFQTTPAGAIVSGSRPISKTIWWVEASYTEEFRLSVFAVCASEG